MGVGGGGGTVKSQRELQCVSIFSCDTKQVCATFLFNSTSSSTMFGEWLNKWAIICCSHFRGALDRPGE